MDKISELAQLFAKYKTYPLKCYGAETPVRIFQRIFPENYYSTDLEKFLSYQDYEPAQKGADLPWWSKNFFGDEQGKKIMIVGQDTDVENAGSIVLEAQYFSDQFDGLLNEIKKYIDSGRRNRIKKQLAIWGINMDVDHLYITDATKVFKVDSGEADEEKSKKLLEAEIEFCNPDLVILLGEPPFNLLVENQKYGFAVEVGKIILVKNRKYVASPCFYGRGSSQKNFARRIEIATNLIKKVINYE